MQTPVLSNAAADLRRQAPARDHTAETTWNDSAGCALSNTGLHLRLRDARGRLPHLFHTLQQSELCFRVRQVVSLPFQPAQVVIQVLDTTPSTGATPTLRCYTFEVESDSPPMAAGQYIRMRQDGPLGVRLELIPLPLT